MITAEGTARKPLVPKIRGPAPSTEPEYGQEVALVSLSISGAN